MNDLPLDCPSDDQLRQILSSGDSREALDRHAASCESCRQRLASLTTDHARPSTFTGSWSDTPTPSGELSVPASGGATAERSLPEIPGYAIQREVGAGGMAVVYEARELELRRTVALKVIRPGYTSPSAVARLMHEAHLLGLLNHPGVARVYGAGTFPTADGPRPYFSMEFVEGRTLLTHLRERHPDLRTRVELAAQVCDAVRHAHQKGIIHRDLKPANILVTAEGKPKVLDFGVARVTDRDRAGADHDDYETMHTQAGALVGTLLYMSPEQVGPNPEQEVDTRSDVYALGLILYQALSGRFPYDLKGKGLGEMIDIIRTAPPTPLRKVDAAIPADLENVAARALEKDKERRYASAQDLADELRRFLRDEPVLARAPTAGEQLRRFVRRNRALVTSAFAVFLALSMGLATTVWQMNVARDAQGRAEKNEQSANEQKTLVLEALQKLDTEKKNVEVEKSNVEAEKKNVEAKNQVIEKVNTQLVVKSQESLSRLIRMFLRTADTLAADRDLLAALPEYVAALTLDKRGGDEEARHRVRVGMLLRQSPQLVRVWAHGDAVTHVEFSPDGRLALSASLDGTARVWDVETGRPHSPPLKHNGPVNHAAFSPDGRFVLTGGDDGRAVVWEADTGWLRGQLRDIGMPVSHVAFHPHEPGRILVAGGSKFSRSYTEQRQGAPTYLPGTVTMVPGPPTMRPGPNGTMIPGPPTMIPHVGPPTMIPGTSTPVTRQPRALALVVDAPTGRVLADLRANGWFNQAVFSPDGRSVFAATGSDEGRSGIHIDDPYAILPHLSVELATLGMTEAPRKLPPFNALVLPAIVHRVAVSPDGTRIVAASGRPDARTGEARMWSFPARQVIGQPLAHAGPVVDVAFSPDGRRVVTASWDNTARVWDASTGEPVTEPLRHENRVVTASFSPDGHGVLTASLDGTARVWDATSGELLHAPMRHGVALTGAAFDPDGHRVLTAARDGSARLWELVPRASAGTVLRHHGVVTPDRAHSFTSTLAGPDGRRYSVTKNYLGDVLATGAVFAPGGRVLTVAGTHTFETVPGGGRAEAQGGVENTHLVVWDPRTGRPLTQALPHKAPVADSLLSPDGRRLVTFTRTEFGEASHLVLWDLPAEGAPGPAREVSRTPPNGGVSALAFRPDGRCLAVTFGQVSKPKPAWVVSVRELTGAAPAWKDLLLPVPGPLEDAAFGPRAETLVTATVRPEKPQHRWELRAWDVASGEPIGAVYDAGPVTRVAVSPTGRHVLGFIGRDVSLVTSGLGTPVPDEARGLVHVWEPATGRARTLRHPAAVTCAAFSPDGLFVATGCIDHTARVWSVETGEVVTPPLKHTDRVNHVAFGPGSLLTASDDRTVRWWALPSGEPLAPPLRHAAAVLWASFAPDGESIAAACTDGTLRFWDCTPDAKPADDLAALAGVLTGQRRDAAGTVTTLGPAALAADVERLRAPGSAGAALAWHRDAADDAEKASDWHAAVFHLDRLIRDATGPATPLVGRRARAHARQGHWLQAEADYARLVEADGSPDAWFLLALLRASLGKTDEYRSTCREVMTRFGKTTDPETAAWVVRTCTLLPDSDADVTELVRIAGVAPPNAEAVRGPALYRAGKFEECAKQLKNVGGLDTAFLALALRRLDRGAEAKPALDRAMRLLEPPVNPAAAARRSWGTVLHAELLRRELDDAFK